MSGPYESVREKVSAIFSKLTQERACNLEATISARKINEVLTAALSEKYPVEVADQIAFNLVDWNSSAAFLVALHLFPENFTPEEIRAGVDLLLIDVPSHMITAARLGNYSAEDISGLSEGYDEPEGA
jgi:hypothetical protein